MSSNSGAADPAGNALWRQSPGILHLLKSAPVQTFYSTLLYQLLKVLEERGFQIETSFTNSPLRPVGGPKKTCMNGDVLFILNEYLLPEYEKEKEWKTWPCKNFSM